MKKFWKTLYSIIFVTAVLSYVTLLLSVIFTWKDLAILMLPVFVISSAIILIKAFSMDSYESTIDYGRDMGTFF